MAIVRIGSGVFAFVLLAATVDARDFTVETVADGIHVFVARDRLDEVDGNSTLIVGRDAALVVDTNTSPAAARAVLAEVRRLTTKPVRYVVNTHWHYDHLHGNQVYEEAFPGVAFIAHEETARIGRTTVAGFVERIQPRLPEMRARLRQRAETGRDADGKTLSAIERDLAGAQLARFDEQERRVAEVRYVAPTVLFRDRLAIDLGERTVEVLHLGRGNTPGDAVVHVPSTRTVVTGDLVVAPTPFGINSFPPDWIDAMRRLLAIDAAVLVPGHGPVMRDARYVHQVIELLEFTVARAQDAVNRGLTLEETRAAVDFAEFRRRFAGDNPRNLYFFDTFWVAPAVERAWRQLRAEF